jgi:hypothetical protein
MGYWLSHAAEEDDLTTGCDQAGLRVSVDVVSDTNAPAAVSAAIGNVGLVSPGDDELMTFALQVKVDSKGAQVERGASAPTTPAVNQLNCDDHGHAPTFPAPRSRFTSHTRRSILHACDRLAFTHSKVHSDTTGEQLVASLPIRPVLIQ